MVRRTTFINLHMLSYRDKAENHAKRVAQAGGEGADVDFLESYYTLVGANVLNPRWYYYLRCGYLLDSNGLVETIFAATGSDLTQPDPAKRAAIIQNSRGFPILYFDGTKEYVATNPELQEIRKKDFVSYYVFQADNGQDRIAPLLMGSDPFGPAITDGTYYIAFIGGNMYTGGQFGSQNPSFYFPPDVTKRGQSQRVMLGDMYKRETGYGRNIYAPKSFTNEFAPTNQAGYSDVVNGGDFILGRNYIGTFDELLNLRDVPASVSNDAVWDWILSHN